jgi:hypothetical protein
MFPGVPQVVPQDVPNSTSILYDLPQFNSHVHQLNRSAKSVEYLFLFCDWGPKNAQCFKKISQSICPLKKKEKRKKV